MRNAVRALARETTEDRAAFASQETLPPSLSLSSLLLPRYDRPWRPSSLTFRVYPRRDDRGDENRSRALARDVLLSKLGNRDRRCVDVVDDTTSYPRVDAYVYREPNSGIFGARPRRIMLGTDCERDRICLKLPSQCPRALNPDILRSTNPPVQANILDVVFGGKKTLNT